jgi:hypothetical protein
LIFDQFIAKYKGKGLDFDGAYSDQCVDLVRFYWRDVLGISQPRGVAGAKDFWTNYDTDPNLKNNFTKIPNTRELIPQKGDVVIWGSSYGKWGHIAIATEGTIDNFSAFSQNDPTGTKSIIKYYPNFNGVLGVLRPKSPNNGSNEPEGDNMSDYEEAIRKAVAYDSVCEVLKQPTATSKEETVKKLSEIISDKERYLRERDEARVQRDNYAEEIKGLNVQIELLKKDKQEQAVQIKSLQESITELNEELENCVAEVPGEEDLESDYEITGRKIIKQVGDTTVETTYKVKE